LQAAHVVESDEETLPIATFDTRANSPTTFFAGCFMRDIMSTEMMGATDMTVSCDKMGKAGAAAW
jgi:hypothetical protein